MNPLLLINKLNKSQEEIDKLPRIYASRGVLFNENGKVILMSCTSENPEVGHYFGLPGGKIEEGETPEQAFIREMREETGFDVDNIIPVCNIAIVRKDYLSVSYGFMGKVISSLQQELQLTDEEKRENQSTVSFSYSDTLDLFNDQYAQKFGHVATLRNITFLLEAKRILNSKE